MPKLVAAAPAVMHRAESRPGALGRRGSRRALLGGAVGSGLGLGIARGAARAQLPPAPPLRFSGWAHVEPATQISMASTLAMFEQIYGASVEEVGISFGATPGQLAALGSTGNLPDVMQLSGHWPHLLGSRGFLADLAPLHAEIPELFQDSFPTALESGTYAGVLYAVPFTVAPLGFWCSREALDAAALDFERPPKTIEELDQALAALDRTLPEGSSPMRIDVSRTEYAVTRFWPWIWTFNGDPMRDDGQGNLIIDWTDEGTVAAFEWLRKTAQSRYLMPADAGQDRQLFAAGRIGFMLDGPYLTSQIANDNPDFRANDDSEMSSRTLINEAFRVAAVPVREEGTPPVTVADFHHLAMANASPHPELASKLIRFLTTNEIAIETFLIPQGGLLPVRSDNTGPKSSGSYDDAIGRAFLTEVAPSMRLPAYDPLYGAAATPIATAIQEIALGATVSVADRLARLTEEVKAVYAEPRA